MTRTRLEAPRAEYVAPCAVMMTTHDWLGPFYDDCWHCGAMVPAQVLERHPSGAVKSWRASPEHMAWHRAQRRALAVPGLVILALGAIILALGILLAVKR